MAGTPPRDRAAATPGQTCPASRREWRTQPPQRGAGSWPPPRCHGASRAGTSAGSRPASRRPLRAGTTTPSTRPSGHRGSRPLWRQPAQPPDGRCPERLPVREPAAREPSYRGSSWTCRGHQRRVRSGGRWPSGRRQRGWRARCARTPACRAAALLSRRGGGAAQRDITPAGSVI